MELHDPDFLAGLCPVASPLLVVLCEPQPVVVRRRAVFAVAAEVVADIAVVAEEMGMREVANRMLGERSLDAVVEEVVGSVAEPGEGFVVKVVEGN